MTKPRPRDPVTGLNASGNGRGIGKVTRPVTKKRGSNKTDAAKAARISKNRDVALSTTTVEGAMQVSPDKPLTEKQKLFVKFWAQGESILSASYKAGYSDGGQYAYRMVHMPNILALYEAEKKAYEDSVQMTRKRVMEGFLESIEMAKLMAEPSTMVAGWREVAKMCGYYEPVKKKIDIHLNGAQQRMERMSDEELMKVIMGAATEALAEEDEA